jgi:putative FmdB family regulatory protein
MVTYSYICKKCGKKFEANCGITDIESEIKCPLCGTKNPEKDRSKYFPHEKDEDFTFPT